MDLSEFDRIVSAYQSLSIPVLRTLYLRCPWYTRSSRANRKRIPTTQILINITKSRYHAYINPPLAHDKQEFHRAMDVQSTMVSLLCNAHRIAFSGTYFILFIIYINSIQRHC
jgi:hypothetical protein